MQEYYTYKYPRPSVTTDCVIFGYDTKEGLSVLLIKRGIEPFKDHWAFPAPAYEMIVTGEKTGKLGPMMENVANYYSNEQSNIVNTLKDKKTIINGIE